MHSSIEITRDLTPTYNTLALQIGSVCCALKCGDEKVYRRLKRLYHSFLTGQPADITLEFEELEHLHPEDPYLAHSESGHVRETGVSFPAAGQIAAGLTDPYHTIGFNGERTPASPDYLDFKYLNRYFSLAYYTACQEKYGGNPPAMLVHACGVLRDGQALVFAGPSEAGKTTIARLCGEQDGEVINDEMLLISRPASNGGGINVQGAPMIGKFPPQRSVIRHTACWDWTTGRRF